MLPGCELGGRSLTLAVRTFCSRTVAINKKKSSPRQRLHVYEPRRRPINVHENTQQMHHSNVFVQSACTSFNAFAFRVQGTGAIIVKAARKTMKTVQYMHQIAAHTVRTLSLRILFRGAIACNISTAVVSILLIGGFTPNTN